MPNYGVKCNKCGIQGEVSLKLAERDEYDGSPELCECGGLFVRVLNKAPAIVTSGGDADYGKRVAMVQQKCREHFEKNERDQLRHKFGDDFKDSLRAGEVTRVKKKYGVRTEFDKAGRRKF